MPKIKLEHPLNSIIQCKFTGFKGRAIAYTIWVNGCNRYLIMPTSLDKDKKMQEAQWFDEQDIELVPDAKPLASVKATRTGGPPIAGDPSR